MTSEYDRLAAAAQAAFDAGQPQDFQLTGKALRLAKGDQELVEAVRMHFLVMAFNRHLEPPGRFGRLH
ncbi:hypothetical protein [Streptosporangium roseum]|uniref:Uncharacterized protein n=1 Tax=Streptosporangium roseum (strain ATCC 12428 / DSM 43021 / JCM 3005 / KCTC 9067 / NCIMB 10171 / NRRL 2505 / NI 9100) TaxID=479432 RepID=D2AUH0_STRRD|nr:hypothetical protein [Streptosporangium roseum]ACZ84832.1 hypothetical protein Sros_1844 [Streptosporangium roseum DSM 43021]